MTQFVDNFVEITSSDEFFDQYSTRVHVLPFDVNIRISEEWILDYADYDTGAQLRESEKNDMAGFIATMNAKGLYMYLCFL